MPNKKDAQLLDVIVATYEKVSDARADMNAIQEVYKGLGTSHKFDAVVISKNEQSKVKIDKTYEAGTRHEALKGFGFGLAAGLVAVVFPPVGIGAALAAGGIGGAVIGAIVGHVQTGIPRNDLREIAAQLETSTAALVVVYEASLADQVKKNIKAVNRLGSAIIDLKADQIASEIRQAAA